MRKKPGYKNILSSKSTKKKDGSRKSEKKSKTVPSPKKKGKSSSSSKKKKKKKTTSPKAVVRTRKSPRYIFHAYVEVTQDEVHIDSALKGISNPLMSVDSKGTVTGRSSLVFQINHGKEEILHLSPKQAELFLKTAKIIE